MKGELSVPPGASRRWKALVLEAKAFVGPARSLGLSGPSLRHLALSRGSERALV